MYTHANNTIFEGKGKCLRDRNSRTIRSIFVHTSYFYEYIIYGDPDLIKSDNKTFLSTVINSTSAIFTGE